MPAGNSFSPNYKVGRLFAVGRTAYRACPCRKRAPLAQHRTMQKALNPAGQGEVERAGCEGPPASVRGEPPESACAAARHCRSFRAAGPHRAVAAPRAPDDGELAASFDGRSVTYGFGELDILVPACAATIHKSQSEYAAVVIPVMIARATPYCNGVCPIPASPGARSAPDARSVMQRFLDQFGDLGMFLREPGQYGLPIGPEPPGVPRGTRGAGRQPQPLRSCQPGG
jgi:hypothetical protein